MRSLEECKAEVFRRSRERIRRRYLAAGVISLTLCITLLAVLPSPKDGIQFSELAPVGSISGTSLQIRSGSQTWDTDSPQAAALLRTIREGFGTDGAAGGPPEKANGSAAVTLIFSEGGEHITYRLSGDILLDSATGQTQYVSKEFLHILDTIMKEGSS